MSTEPPPAAGIAWPLTLAAATVAGTLATACMLPFVALAVLAAATLPRSAALVTVAGVWAVNQLLGFGMLGYPLESYALIWGAAIGATALCVALAAGAWLAGRATPARATLAFVAGFAGYEALLYLLALVTGGTETFAPAIVARIFANDALWFAGLGAVYLVLSRAAPRLYPAPRTA
jgi:hypothetical protein